MLSLLLKKYQWVALSNNYQIYHFFPCLHRKQTISIWKSIKSWVWNDIGTIKIGVRGFAAFLPNYFPHKLFFIYLYFNDGILLATHPTTTSFSTGGWFTIYAVIVQETKIKPDQTKSQLIGRHSPQFPAAGPVLHFQSWIGSLQHTEAQTLFNKNPH